MTLSTCVGTLPNAPATRAGVVSPPPAVAVPQGRESFEQLLAVVHALLPFRRFAIFHERDVAPGQRRMRHWLGCAEDGEHFHGVEAVDSSVSMDAYLAGLSTDARPQRGFCWRDMGTSTGSVPVATHELHAHMRGGEGVAASVHWPADRSRTLLQLECEVTSESHAKTLLAGVIAAYLHSALAATDPARSTHAAEAHAASLTGKERDVLQWVLQGKTSWEVGLILSISERTVKFHLKNVYEKLNVSNRAQAVALISRLGLV